MTTQRQIEAAVAVWRCKNVSVDRVPSYVDADRLCHELCSSMDEINEAIANGSVPPPTLKNGKERWLWTQVEKWIDTRVEAGFVYLIKAGDYVKIGFSNVPDARLRDLQIGNPFKLSIIKKIRASRRWEHSLHYRFRHLRMEGEWFRLEGELAAWIAEDCPC